jgi:hypothetical protein
MLNLEDITDSSDDEENDIPLLKSFSEASENEDNLYGDYKAPEVSEKSANLEEAYDSMPKLIPNYDNLEDDDLEDGNFSGEFLDSEEDRLVEYLGSDAFTSSVATVATVATLFTRTFMCAMVANTGRVTEGVETELYDSRKLCHMTAYHD